MILNFFKIFDVEHIGYRVYIKDILRVDYDAKIEYRLQKNSFTT